MYSYHCETFVCFRKYLFVRAPFAQKLRDFAEEGRPDTTVCGRGLGAIRALWSAWRALKLFFSAGMDKTSFRGFCMRPYFIYMRMYDTILCFFFARSALGAQTTKTTATTTAATTAAVQRACYNQLATMLHDVLHRTQLVDFIGPWDPTSRTELGLWATAVCCVC